MLDGPIVKSGPIRRPNDRPSPLIRFFHSAALEAASRTTKTHSNGGDRGYSKAPPPRLRYTPGARFCAIGWGECAPQRFAVHSS